ncbi:MAG TPA: hypothetical protein EYG11_04175 [Candidatus Latescibacteria bacterium]|nr:hypothetical protein [Candidatus Handelsmanbacteria bacterium]HIL07876.1 hypothetical protein [Candidatus Latescibacterota bacterium]
MDLADALHWQVHPLRWESPVKSALLAGLILASSASAAIGFEHWLYGGFSLLVLLIAVSRYFFPTQYILDGEGLVSVHLGLSRRRSWTEFQRVDEHRDGIFLGPFVRSGRLDSFRGVFLRFHQNREEVVYFVRHHVPAQ